MLEEFVQWNLVKYLGSLINPDNLQRRIDKIIQLYETNTFGNAAKSLLIWCLVIILIGTVIDQIFYWARPEQRIRVLKLYATIKKYKKIFNNKIKKNKQRG